MAECDHEWIDVSTTDDYGLEWFKIQCLNCELELSGDQVAAALNDRKLKLRLVELEKAGD